MAKKFAKRYLKPTSFDSKDHWMVGLVWPVKGSKGNEYNVELHDRGFDCDCPGFGFHGYCKHSRSVDQRLTEAFEL